MGVLTVRGLVQELVDACERVEDRAALRPGVEVQGLRAVEQVLEVE